MSFWEKRIAENIDSNVIGRNLPDVNKSTLVWTRNTNKDNIVCEGIYKDGERLQSCVQVCLVASEGVGGSVLLLLPSGA